MTSRTMLHKNEAFLRMWVICLLLCTIGGVLRDDYAIEVSGILTGQVSVYGQRFPKWGPSF
ncbi:unnamed protein product [Lathyrus sativus]|nr:unnamed protein product [Lathyrus sativus]